MGPLMGLEDPWRPRGLCCRGLEDRWRPLNLSEKHEIWMANFFWDLKTMYQVSKLIWHLEVGAAYVI